MFDVTMALVDIASINISLVYGSLWFLFDPKFLHDLAQHQKQQQNNDQMDQIINHYVNLIIAILINIKEESMGTHFYIDIHKAYNVITSIFGKERLEHSLNQWFLAPSPPSWFHISTTLAKLLYLALINDKSQSELYLNVLYRQHAFEIITTTIRSFKLGTYIKSSTNEIINLVIKQMGSEFPKSNLDIRLVRTIYSRWYGTWWGCPLGWDYKLL
ncbi:hypothetical protein SAMD00019534_026060 [Acytostelium subglobosum LB1]|uniref:hypothetical protein n=1 Tax=Acytostelium subglobosum LB1 TaxID=1410327 RepID=UPI000644C452|nr:hypothetical protein SAMD00019534_026060 [Acytostelium subglobosum LB1]GAM19431.1 hypothetical protein SAMD00019534_026060 [Acytostelium subglobosum LB1]|eukprot:XP_012757358.1 hypothetical protein SAMD00019534_026060 [Acytostelium subglobosum LB1]